MSTHLRREPCERCGRRHFAGQYRCDDATVEATMRRRGVTLPTREQLAGPAERQVLPAPVAADAAEVVLDAAAWSAKVVHAEREVVALFRRLPEVLTWLAHISVPLAIVGLDRDDAPAVCAALRLRAAQLELLEVWSGYLADTYADVSHEAGARRHGEVVTDGPAL